MSTGTKYMKLQDKKERVRIGTPVVIRNTKSMKWAQPALFPTFKRLRGTVAYISSLGYVDVRSKAHGMIYNVPLSSISIATGR